MTAGKGQVEAGVAMVRPDGVNMSEDFHVLHVSHVRQFLERIEVGRYVKHKHDGCGPAPQCKVKYLDRKLGHKFNKTAIIQQLPTDHYLENNLSERDHQQTTKNLICLFVAGVSFTLCVVARLHHIQLLPHWLSFKRSKLKYLTVVLNTNISKTLKQRCGGDLVSSGLLRKHTRAVTLQCIMGASGHTAKREGGETTAPLGPISGAGGACRPRRTRSVFPPLGLIMTVSPDRSMDAVMDRI